MPDDAGTNLPAAPGPDEPDWVDPRSPLTRVRKHLIAVVVLTFVTVVLAFTHSGHWYDHRPLLAVAFLLGMLAAPWALVVPFLVKADLNNLALLVVLVGAGLNVWVRYLGYKHGLADSREARAWRSGRPQLPK